MKTNKLLAIGLALSSIVSLGLSSTSAMYGQGNGSGMGNKSGMMDYQNQNLINSIELQDLSDEEKEMLSYSYSEEMLAHDIYEYFYELYGINTFKNIADSESQHMQSVKLLLDRYELDIPDDYGDLDDEFEELKAEGQESLEKALEVGIKIEILDIEDLVEMISNTDNDDFKVIFTNIGGASYNHLRGFLMALENNGLSTDIDYSDYLDDTNTRGNIKNKIIERLEEEGVELPDNISNYSYMGNNSHMKNNFNANYNKYANNSVLKAKYKTEYVEKYGTVISKMSDDKIETFIGKIDDLLEKVNSGKYSDLLKEKYNSMLIALREIALENISSDDSLIESLFE